MQHLKSQTKTSHSDPESHPSPSLGLALAWAQLTLDTPGAALKALGVVGKEELGGQALGAGQPTPPTPE